MKEVLQKGISKSNGLMMLAGAEWRGLADKGKWNDMAREMEQSKKAESH